MVANGRLTVVYIKVADQRLLLMASLACSEHPPAKLLMTSGCKAVQASMLSVTLLLRVNRSVSELELTSSCVCRANPCILQKL